jgi:GxxExxY protein
MLVDEDLTRIVIGCAHRVYNVLGTGLPESVYVGALEHECRKQGLHVAREYPIAVHYDGIIVGSFRADLLIERHLIVEAKACPFHESHGKQLLTYLRCSDVELGIVISFDPKPHVKRFIMRNVTKGRLRQTDRDRRVDAKAAAEHAMPTLK